MTPLESRKHLLLAESELNRAGLGRDVAALRADVHSFALRARSLRTLVTTATVLVAGATALRQKKSAAAAGKISWWQAAIKTAGGFFAFREAFSPPGNGPEKN